ncbi:hypothetical protein F4782DRAFT_550240 [Xylaria castorea]|nr:hypothetical protein F4782DRAFT_550240 [Xylaria castorea]
MAINEKHRPYVDLVMEPELRFCQTARELCGLFVTIIDSKIYLLRQIAKEFLVQQELAETTSIPAPQTKSLQWKLLLQLVESHRIVAETCIWHLLIDEFKSSSRIEEKGLRRYSDKYVFFNYSAENWTTHFREARVRNDSPMQHSILPLFNVERATTWFDFYALSRYTPLFNHNSPMLVSYFGFEGVTRPLLERAAKLEAKNAVE